MLQLKDIYTDRTIEHLKNIYTSLQIGKIFEEFIDITLRKISSEMDEYEENDDYKIISTKASSLKKIKLNLFLNFLADTICYNGLPNKLTIKALETIYSDLIAKTELEILPTAPSKLLIAYEFYHKTSANDSKRFFEAYKCDDFTTYFKNELTKIYNWVHDDNSPIVSFSYIDMVIPSKKRAYIVKHIDFMYHKATFSSIKEESEQLSMNIEPFDYSIPIDPSNRRMTNSKTKDTDGAEVFSYVHEISENERFVTLIAAPKSNSRVSKRKLFNSFDNTVIKNLIKLSDKDFFVNRRVFCEFGDLVKLVSPNRNDKAYKEVRDSISKIDSFRMRYENDATGELIPYDICKIKLGVKYSTNKVLDISMDEPINVPYQKLMVYATFSEEYINKLLEGVVFTDNVLSFKSGMAEALIGPLQNERYKILDSNNYIVKLGYNSFFNVVLLLGRSNKSKYLSKIEEALEEIKQSKTIIKSFERRKDYFYIEFLKLENNEKEKLIASLENYEKKGLSLTLPFTLNMNNKSLT